MRTGIIIGLIILAGVVAIFFILRGGKAPAQNTGSNTGIGQHQQDLQQQAASAGQQSFPAVNHTCPMGYILFPSPTGGICVKQ